jgi:hypothetical protein
MKLKKQKSAGTAKSSVRRRARLVEGSQRATAGMPGSETDAKRRMGNFETAGEHARLGGRTSGIVGQRTDKFSTDKFSTNKLSTTKGRKKR